MLFHFTLSSLSFVPSFPVFISSPSPSPPPPSHSPAQPLWLLPWLPVELQVPLRRGLLAGPHRPHGAFHVSRLSGTRARRVTARRPTPTPTPTAAAVAAAAAAAISGRAPTVPTTLRDSHYLARPRLSPVAHRASHPLVPRLIPCLLTHFGGSLPGGERSGLHQTHHIILFTGNTIAMGWLFFMIYIIYRSYQFNPKLCPEQPETSENGGQCESDLEWAF